MNELSELLAAVRDGTVSVDQAIDRVRDAYFGTLEHSTLDQDRASRTGAGEVIFGAGKTPEHVCELVTALVERNENVLVTRVDAAQHAAMSDLPAGTEYHPHARLLTHVNHPPQPASHPIAVVSAGTSDAAVAEEAALTAEFYGNPVLRANDVGIAGIHRLFARIEELRSARVVIAVAGMEGALPSVVGGLVTAPVIAVPTSVGYGAAFDGVAALLGMLTSCASGVSVVNIDNGFGAGFLANRINRLIGSADGNRNRGTVRRAASHHRPLRQCDRGLLRWCGQLVGRVCAGQTLGPRSLAVTSGTPSLKRSDLSLAEYLANDWGIAHRVIDTDELANPDYRANPTNRCFFCKTALYEALREIAVADGYDVIFNGTNVDDLGDHRPGSRQRTTSTWSRRSSKPVLAKRKFAR